MKRHWVWGIHIKEASAKEASIVQMFTSRPAAVSVNDAEYEGKGKIVRVASYR